jgi:co-chaperonin GroES (HSP10)
MKPIGKYIVIETQEEQLRTASGLYTFFRRQQSIKI